MCKIGDSIWIGGCPHNSEYLAASLLEYNLPMPPSEITGKRVAAFAYRQAGHQIPYALLGAMFIPNASGILRIQVIVSRSSEESELPGRFAEIVFSELVTAAYLGSEMQQLGSGLLRVERARSYPSNSPIRAGFRFAAIRLLTLLHPRVDSLSDDEIVALTRTPIPSASLDDLSVLTRMVRANTDVIRREGLGLIKQVVLHHIAEPDAIEAYNEHRFVPLALTALPQRSGHEPAIPTEDRLSGHEPRISDSKLEMFYLQQLTAGSLTEKLQAVEWLVLNASPDGLRQMSEVLDHLHDQR